MNSLILSLAPFGGIAAALPAMTAAESGAALQDLDGAAEARSFAFDEDREAVAAEPERDGAYLFV